MVIVDRADVAIDYGSTTAAPFAGEILAQSLAYLGCAPTQSAETLEKVQVPDVTGMSVGQAKATLQETGLDCVLDGVGAQVIAQLPAPGADMAEGSLVMLYVEGAQAETEAVSVPDVTGLSVVEANRLFCLWTFNDCIGQRDGRLADTRSGRNGRAHLTGAGGISTAIKHNRGFSYETERIA